MEIIVIALIFLMGASVGSFFNVVVMRRDSEVKFYQGRSKCGNCGKELETLDLIPIFSYLGLKGKCRNCGTKLTNKYLIGELISAVAFMTTYMIYGVGITSISEWILTISFLLLGISDLHTQEIRYKYFLIPFITLIVLNMFSKGNEIYYVQLLAIFLVTYIIFIFSNNKMGGADVLMLAYIAGFHGIQWTGYIMILACTISILEIGIIYLKQGKETALKTPVPFITSLVVAKILIDLAMIIIK